MVSLQGVPQNAASFLRRFLIAKGAEIARKTAEQFLLNIGLKLALQIGPVDIVAANDKGFILFPICSILQEFSGSNIMAADPLGRGAFAGDRAGTPRTHAGALDRPRACAGRPLPF